MEWGLAKSDNSQPLLIHLVLQRNELVVKATKLISGEGAGFSPTGITTLISLKYSLNVLQIKIKPVYILFTKIT